MNRLKRLWTWLTQPANNWLVALLAAAVGAAILLLLVYLLQNFLGGLL